MLTVEAFIADYMLAGHSYDITSFDFQKAFEKIPHAKVIQGPTNKRIKGSAMKWFSSFLLDRTHQVRLENSFIQCGTCNLWCSRRFSMGPKSLHCGS